MDQGVGVLIALFGAIPAIVVLGAAATYDGAAGAWALILSAVGAVATCSSTTTSGAARSSAGHSGRSSSRHWNLAGSMK